MINVINMIKDKYLTIAMMTQGKGCSHPTQAPGFRSLLTADSRNVLNMMVMKIRLIIIILK